MKNTENCNASQSECRNDDINSDDLRPATEKIVRRRIERTNSTGGGVVHIDALDRFFRGRVFRRGAATTISARGAGPRPAVATGVHLGDNEETTAAASPRHLLTINAYLLLFMTTYGKYILAIFTTF